MEYKNLLIISNNYPNIDNSYVADIFVKEQVKYLKRFFKLVYIVSPVAYGMEKLRKTTYEDYQYDNVKVFFPKYFNIPFLYNNLRSLWVYLETKAILKLIEKERITFDIMHAHFTWPSGAVAIELKSQFKKPLVITEHTHVTLNKELQRKNSNYIRIWKKSDAIIRVTKKDIPLFINSGIESNKIYHIGNGYDQNKYYPISKEKAREMLNLLQNDNIILHISRLTKVKGQEYLIQSLYDLKKKRTNFMCYIGGSGPESKNIENAISEMGLQENVRLIGFVPENEICLWMNACDVFVLPSLSESFGIVQIEAMACGKPVVATINGGSEGIITSDDFGFLVKPRDSRSLSEKINIALDKKWDAERIIKYAARYQWDIISKQIIDVYKEIYLNRIL
jgi:glycosyltransferase involved in cell wall biosynthesis